MARKGTLVLEAVGLAASPPGCAAEVITGVTLCIGRGEWVGLSGPNGSGKTTLLLALAGLWPASRGTARLDGVPLGPSAPPDLRRRIAVILQEPPDQLMAGTVREELEFSLVNLGWDGPRRDAAIGRWARAFGLEALLGRPSQSLSAGEQQRVLLGAALALEPDLLVADEPGAHLDSGWRAVALERVNAERHTRGLSVLWSTQEAAELAPADHVWELEAGRLSEPRRTEHAPRPQPRTPAQDPLATVRITPVNPGAERAIRVAAPLVFDLPRRGVVVIGGPNGSGKSVLLSALAGLEPCFQVEPRWAGVPPARPAFAAQFPDRQLFCERVCEEVLFGARKRGADRVSVEKRLEGWLEDAGLVSHAFLERPTAALSAGEKRLVVQAGALLTPAAWYALDEPTAGLDPARAAAVGRWVGEAARDALVVVASQHAQWAEWLGAHRLSLTQPDPDRGPTDRIPTVLPQP
jgi:energy-coupling factor transporter ATP-binding protein EcfA2